MLCQLFNNFLELGRIPDHRRGVHTAQGVRHRAKPTFHAPQLYQHLQSWGHQGVLHLSPEVFAVVRHSPERDEHILALTNVTGREIHLEVPLSEVEVKERDWQDLLGDGTWESRGAPSRSPSNPTASCGSNLPGKSIKPTVCS
jgi:hypothetical protein